MSSISLVTGLHKCIVAMKENELQIISYYPRILISLCLNLDNLVPISLHSHVDFQVPLRYVVIICCMLGYVCQCVLSERCCCKQLCVWYAIDSSQYHTCPTIFQTAVYNICLMNYIHICKRQLTTMCNSVQIILCCSVVDV